MQLVIVAAVVVLAGLVVWRLTVPPRPKKKLGDPLGHPPAGDMEIAEELSWHSQGGTAVEAGRLTLRHEEDHLACTWELADDLSQRWEKTEQLPGLRLKRTEDGHSRLHLITRRARRWNLPLPEEPGRYAVELGLRDERGVFHPWLLSNEITVHR